MCTLCCGDTGHRESLRGFDDPLRVRTQICKNDLASSGIFVCITIEPEAPAWQAEILPLNQWCSWRRPWRSKYVLRERNEHHAFMPWRQWASWFPTLRFFEYCNLCLSLSRGALLEASLAFWTQPTTHTRAWYYPKSIIPSIVCCWRWRVRSHITAICDLNLNLICSNRIELKWLLHIFWIYPCVTIASFSKEIRASSFRLFML